MNVQTVCATYKKRVKKCVLMNERTYRFHRRSPGIGQFSNCIYNIHLKSVFVDIDVVRAYIRLEININIDYNYVCWDDTWSQLWNVTSTLSFLHNSQMFFGIVRHSNPNIRNGWFSCNFCLFKILLNCIGFMICQSFFSVFAQHIHAFNTCSNNCNKQIWAKFVISTTQFNFKKNLKQISFEPRSHCEWFQIEEKTESLEKIINSEQSSIQSAFTMRHK